jgi:hypothetical protein
MRWERQSAEKTSRADDQLKQLAAEKADLETRRDALNEERRRWEDQRSRVTSEASDRTEQLRSRLAEVEAAQRDLDEARQRWETSQVDAKQALAVREAEFESQRMDLEVRQQAFEDERRRHERHQSTAADQMASSEEQIQGRLAEIEAARVSLEDRQKEWEAARAASERELDARRDAIHRQQVELESQREAIAEERRQWEAERLASAEAFSSGTPSDIVEPEFEKPSEEAPVDLADVFRRLGKKVDVEDEPEPELQARAPEPREKDLRRPVAATLPHPDKKEDGEESIEDYMQRLMQRVSGSTEMAYTAPAVRRRDRVEESQPVEATPAKVVAPAIAKDRPPAKLSPRAVAPETSLDISALRELANLSAQIAIGRYSHKVFVKTMLSKLVVATVSLVSGLALLWMWYSLSAAQMTLYAAMLALLATFYWGLEYTLMTGRLIVSKSGQIDIGPKPALADKIAVPPREASLDDTDSKEERASTTEEIADASSASGDAE